MQNNNYIFLIKLTFEKKTKKSNYENLKALDFFGSHMTHQLTDQFLCFLHILSVFGFKLITLKKYNQLLYIYYTFYFYKFKKLYDLIIRNFNVVAIFETIFG